MKKNHLIFVIFAILLSACSGLPTHDSNLKEDVKVEYAQEAFSLNGHNKLPGKWWLALQDDKLNRLIEQALKNSNNLKISLLKIKQSLLDYQSTDASQSVNVNATAGISSMSSETLTSSTSTDKYSVGVVASYEWDLWDRLSGQLKNTALSIESSKLDYKTLSISISSNVALTWYKLIEQNQQLSLLKEQLAISEGYLQLIEQKFKSGQALAADVLQQRQVVESVKGAFNNTLRQIAQFKNQLALLLSTPQLDVLPAKNSKIPELPALPEIGLKTVVINNRPDVQLAFNQLAMADNSIAVAVADRFPKVSFSASYERNGGDLNSIFDNWLSSLAANLIVPIVDADKKVIEVKKKENSYQQGLLNYRQKILNAVKEVEDALVKEENQRRFVVSLKKQLQLSNQATEQIRSSYINGAMDFTRVLNAVLSDQNLQRNYIKANRDLIEYRIDLYRALSGGWES